MRTGFAYALLCCSAVARIAHALDEQQIELELSIVTKASYVSRSRGVSPNAPDLTVYNLRIACLVGAQEDKEDRYDVRVRILSADAWTQHENEQSKIFLDEHLSRMQEYDIRIDREMISGQLVTRRLVVAVDGSVLEMTDFLAVPQALKMPSESAAVSSLDLGLIARIGRLLYYIVWDYVPDCTVGQAMNVSTRLRAAEERVWTSGSAPFRYFATQRFGNGREGDAKVGDTKERDPYWVATLSKDDSAFGRRKKDAEEGTLPNNTFTVGFATLRTSNERVMLFCDQSIVLNEHIEGFSRNRRMYGDNKKKKDIQFAGLTSLRISIGVSGTLRLSIGV